MAIRCVKALKKETKRERGSALPRCARAWSCAVWEISFMRLEKSAGTDSVQLFSIKLYMAYLQI